MNECIKTGFVFLELETGVKRNGDLFYISGYFQVRGVNVTPMPADYPIDAIVTNIILAHRANSTYMDSNFGISVIAPSKEFADHISKWYPDLKLVIVRTEGNDGQTARTTGG